MNTLSQVKLDAEIGVMKFCKKCQEETERYIYGECKLCCKRYYEANKDKVKADSAAYRAANKDKAKVWRAAWRAANPEKDKASSAAYREANREKERARKIIYYKSNSVKVNERIAVYRVANKGKVSAYAAVYYAENKEKIEAGRAVRAAANPEQMRVIWRNSRARRRNADGKHTAADIRNLMTLQKSKCACCKKSIKDCYHVDHNLPLAKGGSNDRLNLQLLCPTCNHQKSAKHPVEFMQSRGFLL